MSDTDITALVERLRGWDVIAFQFQEEMLEAADALEALQAEVERLREILMAIAEGYPVKASMDRFVIVENPRYTPDNGEAPNLVWDGGEDDD